MTYMIHMCGNFHAIHACSNFSRAGAMQVTLHEIVQLQRLLGPGAHDKPLDTEAESRVEDQAAATLGLRGEGGAPLIHSSAKVAL